MVVERTEDPARVPPDAGERERLRGAVRHYVAGRALVPPLPLDELQHHAAAVAAATGAAARYRDLLTVLLSNEVWRETIAAVPFERRILLLPQCLRARARCPGEADAFGVLCAQCGQCPIGALQAEAEQLGYLVLVAEGSTVVGRLLEQGRVDAVIGASCLEVLEKSFPRMAEEAIPGIAIPLCRAGCDCTEVDLEWLQEFIRLRSDAPWFGRPDLDGLREDVNAWFEPKALQTALGAPWTRTEDLALDWLAKGGKRWRPVLTVAACRALDRSGQKDSATAHKLALSAECFHKASLIHDDIEDEDEERYGEPTLHRRYGTAMALNVGDYLLGEGYRLVAESGAPADRVVRMLAAAAEGHRTLCLGQGQELNWRLSPVPLRSEEILEIFRRKTAPAFDVALQFGAIAAGADPETCAALHEFSQALGVGYQIRDDLDDLSGPDNDLARHRLSLLPALACEHAPEGRREAVAAAWTGGDAAALRQAVVELGIPDRARTLLANQRQLAIRALQPLRSPMLKSLLRRVLSRILGKS